MAVLTLALYYSLIYTTAYIANVFSRLIPSPRLSKLYRDVAFGLLVVVCSANYGLAWETGGPWLLATLFLINPLIFTFILPDATGFINQLIEEYITGVRTLANIIFTLLCQIAAVYVFHKKVRPEFYVYGLTPLPVHAPGASCDVMISTSVLAGFLVEFYGGVLDAGLSSYRIARNQLIDLFFKLVIFTGFTMTFLEATGFFVNPLNALGYNLGCRGASTLDLVTVYGAAPVLGYTITFSFLRSRWWKRPSSSTVNNNLDDKTVLNGQNGALIGDKKTD